MATMAAGYWLLKTEPGEWGWEHQADNKGISNWDGVRNAQAQKNLRSMQQGDYAFFYHSGGKAPAVVGVVEVVKTAYPDVSDESGKSCMVDVRALASLPNPVPLSALKAEESMRDWSLLRQSRLSVMPVSPAVWIRVCELGDLNPPPTLPCAENVLKSKGEVVSKMQVEVSPLAGKELQREKKKVRPRGMSEPQVEAEEAEPQKRSRRLAAKTEEKKSVTTVPVMKNQVVKKHDEPTSSETEFPPVVEVKTYQRKKSNKTLGTTKPRSPSRSKRA